MSDNANVVAKREGADIVVKIPLSWIEAIICTKKFADGNIGRVAEIVDRDGFVDELVAKLNVEDTIEAVVMSEVSVMIQDSTDTVMSIGKAPWSLSEVSRQVQRSRKAEAWLPPNVSAPHKTKADRDATQKFNTAAARKETALGFPRSDSNGALDRAVARTAEQAAAIQRGGCR